MKHLYTQVAEVLIPTRIHLVNLYYASQKNKLARNIWNEVKEVMFLRFSNISLNLGFKLKQDLTSTRRNNE